MCARTTKSLPAKKTTAPSKPAPKKAKASPSHPVFGETAHPSLSHMKLKKNSVSLTFDSLPDLHVQTLALADHIERVQAPVPVAGTTFLGRNNAEVIVSDCANSDDLTLTVAQCGKTGHGMQQAVEGKLTADGFDPAPLKLNIQNTDFLNTIVTEIAKAKK